MGIIDEIKKILNRTQQRAVDSARSSNLNREAWQKIVTDLGTMRRLREEINQFLDATERAAESRFYNAQEQVLIDDDQVRDLESVGELSDHKRLFDKNDIGTVAQFLEDVDPATFGGGWWRITAERREILNRAIGNK